MLERERERDHSCPKTAGRGASRRGSLLFHPVALLEHLVDPPHGLGLPSFRETWLLPGPAIEIDVHPVGAVVGELLQEQGGSDRPSPGRGPDVVHVRHLAVEHLRVRLPKGKPPHGVVALHALLVQRACKVLVVRENPRQVPAQGHPVRSGQGSHVEQDVRLVALGGQGEAVRKDQPAFGVRVPDLHGEPAPAREHVARAEGVPRDGVLHAGQENPES
mmetsp:Transcript_7798/g.22290  ORF Transcript_7798/g.22290 Transcript_7798/m.22290 type:complete len:218 (+) Transcript_7798:218-871(+)